LKSDLFVFLGSSKKNKKKGLLATSERKMSEIFRENTAAGSHGKKSFNARYQEKESGHWTINGFFSETLNLRPVL
jgi:hypothetical protein